MTKARKGQNKAGRADDVKWNATQRSGERDGTDQYPEEKRGAKESANAKGEKINSLLFSSHPPLRNPMEMDHECEFASCFYCRKGRSSLRCDISSYTILPAKKKLDLHPPLYDAERRSNCVSVINNQTAATATAAALGNWNRNCDFKHGRELL